ncbi:hypothetical protein [Profundibacterium mesophilum]|nr:hypothetical protein [Profundibacterium mesophilum]
MEVGHGMNGLGVYLAVAGLLIAAGVVLPYFVIGGGGAPGFGLVLFWLGFAGAVIALIASGVSGWRR